MTAALENPPQNRERFAEAGVVALVASVLFAISFSLAVSKGQFLDEHQYIAAGALVARESLFPYKDYPFFHMPYLPFIYGGIFLFSDHLLFSARLVSVFCAATAGTAIFCVARRRFRNRAGRWLVPLSATGFFVTASQFTHTTGHAWNQEPAMLCALLFFLAYMAAFRSARPERWIVTAGLLLGLGIGIRITLAPLVGALILMLALFPPAGVTRTRLFGVAAFGLTVALLPAFILFLTAPEQFFFGNLEFAKVNDVYRQYTNDTMAFTKKLRFTARQIAMNLPLVSAFLGATIIAFLHARATRLPVSREIKALLVTFPFLLMGALAPSPVYRQYFYPLLPFLALGGVYALESVDDSSKWWRRSVIWGGVCLTIAITFAVSPHRHLREVFSIANWAPWQIHNHAVEMCTPAPRTGRVLTLGPIWPLEAKLAIYPELATGPFAFRISHLIPPERRVRLKFIGMSTLQEKIAADPPAACFFGTEKYLDPPIQALAKAHGFVPVSVFETYELWARPMP